MRVKPAAVAGYFYPEHPEVLLDMITSLLDENSKGFATLPIPKAIIVPHAGLVYSGAVAASIYQSIKPLKNITKKVLLIGPAHRVSFKGIAASTWDVFATPMGDTLIDKKSVQKAIDGQLCGYYDIAFDKEHCLEVQLPFLNRILGNYKLCPFLVGDSPHSAVADLIKLYWDDEDTLVVISSDLSHYHPYQEAKVLDNYTTNSILTLQPELIKRDHACGRIAIQGLLQVAKEKGLKPTLVDLRNSGDTFGNKDSVVGYGAYHFV